MRVEILPALVHYPPDRCMEIALEAFKWSNQFPGGPAEKAAWVWLFRWAGMPV